MNILSVMLQAPTGDAPAASGGGGMGFVFIGAMVLVFYFFMIRPQAKKAKEQKKFMAELKKGDKIITIGGIHAKIADVQETTFLIEVEGGNKLKINKTAVSKDQSDSLLNEQK